MFIEVKQTTHCKVCGKSVADKDQTDHLKSNHLGPHYFWFEMKRHRTMKPSMTVSDLLTYIKRDDGPNIFEERDGERIYLFHDQAVDLTQEPYFFVDLPAHF